MTRYTPDELPAVARYTERVSGTVVVRVVVLFFDLLQVECYMILLMKSDNIAERMRAKPLDRSAIPAARGVDYRIHSMIKKVANDTHRRNASKVWNIVQTRESR